MAKLQTRPRLAPGLIIPVATVALIAAYRLAPHPWNVAPVGALFALSGLYLGRGWKAWALPFAAVMASDAVVYLRWDGSLAHPERLGDYLAFAPVLLMGRWGGSRGAAARIASVLMAPVVFFAISNFAVWLGAERLYPHTLAGLRDCYVAAIPFFRGTLAGDWLFGLAGMAAIEGLPRLAAPRVNAA
jgi:hypothetical protein